MTISALNHLMSYVIEGWMILSAASVSFGFVRYVARQVQAEERAAQAERELAALQAAEAQRVAERAAVSEKLEKEKQAAAKTSVSVSTR
ncbi:hypothetical protein IQ241_21945 [Romeria aff. gracilis LEGE 07310]|uniref:Uncharacterized protein n=1 Tax=Vasconcelosia minhoensis LEGE 07310 TaxID=915328 RepID=A0A8J7ALA9_9CYAN|nr:hypothetical protein [Romeria gracilis]MBE9079918.1 hypothetical protein [Romeria aff. gracilis LEGE 07310]